MFLSPNSPGSPYIPQKSKTKAEKNFMNKIFISLIKKNEFNLIQNYINAITRKAEEEVKQTKSAPLFNIYL